jgi:RNA polymerase sigma-70 factor (ECF subfamily)
VDYTLLDDESLLRLIIKSNDQALSALYDRYGRLVYSIALNSLGDSSLAEEVTQDVFLRVWQRAVTYDIQQSRVVTWLASIARHRAIDILRQQRVRPESTSLSWADIVPNDPPDDQNVEDEAEWKARRQRIQQAMAQIPEEQRLALGLSYFRAMSHQEIADQLGIPLGTIKTRIRLGLQKLRQILEE